MFRQLISSATVAVAAAAVLFALPAAAATITVNTSIDGQADEGLCTLREAIIAANTNAASGATSGECGAGAAGADTIQFSFGGPVIVHTLAIQNTALPTITQPLTINGFTAHGTSANTLANGNDAVLRVQLQPGGGVGSPGNVYGLTLGSGSSGSDIRGLIINGFGRGGILVQSSNNTIAGCFIGTNSDGTSPAANGTSGSDGGILIAAAANGTNASNNIIGGATPATRNVIAGNIGPQIAVTATNGGTASGNQIVGNYIGTNKSGTAALTAQSTGTGVYILGASTTKVGSYNPTWKSACSGSCNLISGNSGGGVAVYGPGANVNTIGSAAGTAIDGNFIGTNGSGTSAIGNGQRNGIFVNGFVASLTIGSELYGHGNVVSGHQNSGIDIYNFDSLGTAASHPITIRGNYVGLSASGNSAIANSGSGIAVRDTRLVTIGGTAATQANYISGNSSHGISMDGGQSCNIQLNYIGLAANLSTAIPNGGDGVRIAGSQFVAASDNVIGPIAPGGNGSNVIVNNLGVGVRVLSGVRNSIYSNLIMGNLIPQIDLGVDGTITPNDACDGDAGANDLQNHPVITKVLTNNRDRVEVTFSLNSQTGNPYNVELFASSEYGAAETRLGSVAVEVSANCSVTQTAVLLGRKVNADWTVVATATNPMRSTSEFSQAVAAELLPAPTISTMSPNHGPSAGGTTVVLTGTNLGGATYVDFGGLGGTIIGNTATSITVVTPAYTPSFVTVTAVVTNGTVTTAEAFRFDSNVKGDFDGDGRGDLFWRNPSTGENAVWRMNGTSIAGSSAIPSAGGWNFLGMTDFDGDARADLLWRNPSSSQVAIWLMDGYSIAAAQIVATVPSNWTVQGLGDFDGDGRGDVLWRNDSTSEVWLWIMNGVSIQAAQYVASPSTVWVASGVGDFNGDGRSDIVWRNSSSSEAVVWLMNGSIIQGSGYAASPNSVWVLKAVADSDGNGKADLIWRNSSTHEVVVWLMNGTAISSTGYAATPGPAWDLQAVTDFSGDARSDMMWRNLSTGENAIWLMNGTSIASGAYITSQPNLQWSVLGPR